MSGLKLQTKGTRCTVDAGQAESAWCIMKMFFHLLVIVVCCVSAAAAPAHARVHWPLPHGLAKMPRHLSVHLAGTSLLTRLRGGVGKVRRVGKRGSDEDVMKDADGDTAFRESPPFGSENGDSESGESAAADKGGWGKWQWTRPDGGMVLECAPSTEHHDALITCLQYKDGYVYSGSVDRTTRVWDAVTGQCLQILQRSGEGEEVPPGCVTSLVVSDKVCSALLE
jgi:hypothetical protein